MEVSYSLTRESALFRADIISSPLTYTLNLLLEEQSYSGQVLINFQTKKPSSSLFLDYSGDTLINATLNSAPLSTSRTENKLNLGALDAGSHQLALEFSSKYSTNGTGLHIFKDPSDSNIYIYSYLFPYYGNKLFPCFDQPDLKGTFKIRIQTYSCWTVLSNELQEDCQQYDELTSIWTFRETPIMSTYLIAVVCGDFQGKDDVYSRSSLNNFIQRDQINEWLTIGKRAYAEFFGIEMQFSKCSQVFCPEFNMGAMENAGCVTINDSHVWKEKPVRSEYNWLQNVVLHELCHMWFGNYVTMKWWDDLWLNESFATFLSYFITFKEIDQEVWVDFLINKLKAYSNDSIESTHPVYLHVHASDEAISNLDTITYWKGASLLKNLAFIIGEETFSAGLKRYFKSFGWGNVDLRDFVESMQSPFLSNWVPEWVETKGLNSLQLSFACTSEAISSVTFIQSNVSGDTYRSHHILAEGFDDSGSVFKHKVLVGNSASGSIPELVSLPAISGLILNSDDHGYVQVILDEKSVNYFFSNKNICKVTTINRGVLWQSLWNRVENFQMKSSEFIDYVSQLLIYEDSEQLIDIISNFASSILNDFTPELYLPEYSHKLFQAVMDKLEVAPKNKCLQRKIFGIACTKEDIEKSYEYSLGLDRGERWKGIMLLSTIKSKEEIKSILHEELKYDKSDVTIFLKNYCRAAAVDNKEKVWRECVQHKKFSLAQANYLMSGFWKTQEQKYFEGYFEKYFEDAPWVVDNQEREYAENFLRLLLPKTGDIDKLISGLESMNLSKQWARRYILETVETLTKSKLHIQNFI